MLKELYKKSLKLAAHKKSKLYLSLVAFAESSFFPIPPDVMIVPMVISKKNDYLKIFLIATISSSAGGLLGYLIGATFIDLGMYVLEFYNYGEKAMDLKNDLSNGAGFYVFLGALFLAGFTPLPFKVFTITSGIIGLNIIIFFFICLLSRGIRFFVVSYLCYKFGKHFNSLVEKHGSKLFLIIGVFALIFFTTIYFFIK
jgi:membrane protein YqaA with SNARE-associated domain